MVSQVLGLYDGKSVAEVILGFLLSIFPSDDSHISKFKFIEFLSKAIYFHLVNFHTLKYCRYPTYLMHLFFFHFNQAEF